MSPSHQVSSFRLGGSLYAFALAGSSLAPAADNWTGTIRSEINITAPGYSHQETQTWTLSPGAPTLQGSRKVYAATWSVTGQGWFDRTNASNSRRIASWTASVSGQSAPISFLVTPSGELQVQAWHAQLTGHKGYTGTDHVIQNGVPFSTQRLEMTVYEWAFQKLQGLPTDTQLTGTHTSQPNAFLGPLQPADATVTVTCVWALGQASAPPLPPPTLPPAPPQPGSNPPTAGPPREPVPQLLSISPAEVSQGAPDVHVTLRGQGTHWQTDVTTVDFGPDIRVAELKVNSPTEVETWIQVSAAAAIGPRAVRLTTPRPNGMETVALPNDFTVNAVLTAGPGLILLPPAAPNPSVLPPPPPLSSGTTSGQYRIILNGFRVNRRTFEGVENDGPGDEIFGAACVQVAKRDLSSWGTTTVRTAVHGCIGPDWPGRVRGGSAHQFGGFVQGDVFPLGQDPARVTTNPIPRTFPLLLWEGTLSNGGDVVVIKPALWEADGDDCVYLQWAEITELVLGPYHLASARQARLQDMRERIAQVDLSMISFVVPRFVCDTTYNAESHCTCRPGRDRPIGVREGEYWGPTIVFTREAIEKALTATAQSGGLPPGVIALRFTEIGQGFGGDYESFIRVERTGSASPPPGAPPAVDVAPVRPSERTIAPEPPTADVAPVRPPERAVAPEPPPSGATLLRLTPPSAQQGRQGVIFLLDTAPSSFFTPGGTADFGPGIALRSFEILSPISARATIDIAPDAPLGPRALTLLRALRPPETFPDVFTITAAAGSASAGGMTGGVMNAGEGAMVRDRLPNLIEAGAPEDPALFTGRQTGPSSVQLTWMPVPGASAYLVRGPAAENGLRFTGTSAIVSGLAPGTYRWSIASWYEPTGVRTPVEGRPSASVTVTGTENYYRVTAESVVIHKDEADNPGWGGDGRSNEIYITSFAQVIDRRDGQQLAAGPLFRSPVHGDTNANPSGGVRVRAGSYTSSGGIRTGDVVPLRAHRTPQGGEIPCAIWEGVLRPGIDVLVLRPVVWEFDGVEGPWFTPYQQRLQAEAPGAIYQNPAVAAWIIQPGLFAGFVPHHRQSGPWTPDREDHPIGLTLASTGGGGLAAGSDPDLTWFDRVIVLTREKLELQMDSNQGVASLETRLGGDGRDWIADCTLRLNFERASPTSSTSRGSSSRESLIQDALNKLQPKIEPGGS
jgi:hypothetical protein